MKGAKDCIYSQGNRLQATTRFRDVYAATQRVLAYYGGKVEPYGAIGGGGAPPPATATNKVVKAVPKVDAEGDAKSGVQKFRVKLLAESGGQSIIDVLCQIGLDGIRMLDPNTSRTLRIYPLENITRCDFKEMGGSRRPSESLRTNEQPTEKKRGFGDWMNLIKPADEEKDHWVPDEAVLKCTACGVDFGAFLRRHHCRNCGDIFCDKCTRGRIALTSDEDAQQVRVCDRCMAEVTLRLSNAKESSSKPVLQSHEDLAKKLQVQVPTSGSETIECGVCQHPFLVTAR
ncbi:hypothetical protein JHK87_048546 [Glycine soja]|nr:hypothetical protein JHK87_048546 [Glycine soja]